MKTTDACVVMIAVVCSGCGASKWEPPPSATSPDGGVSAVDAAPTIDPADPDTTTPPPADPMDALDAGVDPAEPPVEPPPPPEPPPPEPPPPPPEPPPPARDDSIPTPTFSDTRSVSRTIVIDEPGVYDYHNVLHEWTGSGDCNQMENQPYVLRIASSDVTVRNFAYRNAPDGIHIGTSSDGQGYNEGRAISNIVLENVVGWACEDALTTQYGVRDVTIRDSIFFPNPRAEYRDKLLQLNFGNVTIERTTFVGSATCVMFKGNQQITIRDSRFIDCERAVNGSTLHGILGRIGTGPSEMLSERNQGYFASRAATWWDPWEFLTAYGAVRITSVSDIVSDGGRNSGEDGGSVVVR